MQFVLIIVTMACPSMQCYPSVVMHDYNSKGSCEQAKAVIDTTQKIEPLLKSLLPGEAYAVCVSK